MAGSEGQRPMNKCLPKCLGLINANVSTSLINPPSSCLSLWSKLTYIPVMCGLVNGMAKGRADMTQYWTLVVNWLLFRDIPEVNLV